MRLFAAACLVGCGAITVIGQSGAANGEWRSYGGDLGHTRYAPLAQIDAVELQHARGRLAVQDGQPRSAAGIPVRIDAADGQGRRLHDRGIAARGRWRSTPRPARCCGCTARTKARAAPTRRDSCPDAASRTGPARPRDDARILYVTPGYRLIALDAKTGAPVASFGTNGVVDLKKDDDQEMDLVDRRDRPACDADRGRQRRDRRRGAQDRRQSEEPPQREGLRARLRRAHRQTALDLPHHSAAGRVRQRHLGEGLVDLHRQHRRVGRRSRSTKSSDSCTCRSSCRPATTTAATARATACSARASSRWICRPASGAGIISWCTTASGTWTSRARRSWSIIIVNGRPVKAVAQPTKQAFLYVFNRETGEPIWPIEERPVREGRRARRVVLADAAVPDASRRPTIARASRSTI